MSVRATSPSFGLPRRNALRQSSTVAILGLGVAVLVGAAVFLFSTGGFASWGNVKAILAASSFVGMIAVGQTVIMISGNFFSMSLGVQAAGSALFFFWALRFGVVPALLLTIALGALVSGIQGFAVGRWAASPIIITIAASVVITGVVVLITGGASVRPPADASIEFLGDRIGGVTVAAFVMVALTLLAAAFLRRTRLGATSYLIGSNRPAARAAGLPVALTISVVFAIAGACAALTGIMMAGVQNNASLALQGTLMFDAIAAVLVGGCAVLGGKGSAVATMLGTVFIAAINSALVLRGYSTGVQVTVKGCLVLAAVVGVHLWRSERR